ncbi:MAG: hypothetical protein KDA24_17660 [Deltaproteobacteria bacterium]|nr:hypothetical protein [Deltaproteobacteria bacterium]
MLDFNLLRVAMPAGALLALLLANSGCNETALEALNAPPQRGDENPLADDDDDDDGGIHGDDDDDNTNEQPADDDDLANDDDAGDDDDGLPPKTIDDCPEGAVFVTDFWGPSGEDEIYVLGNGNNPTEATATLVSPVAGLFDLYDISVAESGNSQTNESGFIRIRNAVNPVGAPAFANCGYEWIQTDPDNEGAPPELFYMGSFDLVEGENEVTLYNYCGLYRQGLCSEFHIGDPDTGGGCNTGNYNSIHLAGEGICLIPR